MPLSSVIPTELEMACMSNGKIDGLGGNNYNDPWADD